MLWAWADAAGARGSAPAKAGAIALAECGKVFLASAGGLEELPRRWLITALEATPASRPSRQAYFMRRETGLVESVASLPASSKNRCRVS